MIRDITIGQYYPVKSILHRLDPRVKLVSTLLYLVSLFLFKSIPGYIVATLFKTGYYAVDDYSDFQSVSDERWGSIVSCMDFYHHRRWSSDGGLYGGTFDLFDHWLIAYDVYNNAE